MRVQMLMNFGEMGTPEKRDYISKSLGWMYRMNDLTAAYARARLKFLEEDISYAL